MSDIHRKNILSIKQYSELTRDKVNDISVKADMVAQQNVQLRAELELLKQQVQQLQVRLYSGGATSGNNS
jgi:polyhydroxyalkanoate synthesis regulator phasin